MIKFVQLSTGYRMRMHKVVHIARGLSNTACGILIERGDNHNPPGGLVLCKRCAKTIKTKEPDPCD